MVNVRRNTELLVLLWQEGDEGRRRKIEEILLQAHSGFLVRAIKVNPSFIGFDDLLNEVRLSIYPALKTFDIKQGVKFTTWWAYRIHSATTYWWKQVFTKHKCHSIDEKINLWKDEEKRPTKKDLIEDESAKIKVEFPVEDIINDCPKLSNRERELLFGVLKYGYTQRVFADKWGVSRQAVSIVKIRAIGKIKRFIRCEFM